MHQAALILPLIIGILITALTVLAHAIFVASVVRLFRRQLRLELVGTGFWLDTAIVMSVVLLALTAHLAEIALWAVFFTILGEFPDFEMSFYHSAVNYTTLGYGDVIMSSKWKTLAPIEAADGMLMFGVSAAIVFAVIQRMVRARYSDLDG